MTTMKTSPSSFDTLTNLPEYIHLSFYSFYFNIHDCLRSRLLLITHMFSTYRSILTSSSCDCLGQVYDDVWHHIKMFDVPINTFPLKKFPKKRVYSFSYHFIHGSKSRRCNIRLGGSKEKFAPIWRRLLRISTTFFFVISFSLPSVPYIQTAAISIIPFAYLFSSAEQKLYPATPFFRSILLFFWLLHLLPLLLSPLGHYHFSIFIFLCSFPLGICPCTISRKRVTLIVM